MPNDRQALERANLIRALTWPEHTHHLLEILSERDFSPGLHREIYAAIKNGTTIDREAALAQLKASPNDWNMP